MQNDLHITEIRGKDSRLGLNLDTNSSSDIEDDNDVDSKAFLKHKDLYCSAPENLGEGAKLQISELPFDQQNVIDDHDHDQPQKLIDRSFNRSPNEIDRSIVQSIKGLFAHKRQQSPFNFRKTKASKFPSVKLVRFAVKINPAQLKTRSQAADEAKALLYSLAIESVLSVLWCRRTTDFSRVISCAFSSSSAQIVLKFGSEIDASRRRNVKVMENFCKLLIFRPYQLCYALNFVEERVPPSDIVEDEKDTEFTLDVIRRQRAACLLVTYCLKFRFNAPL
ncbi:hypothetical protein OUZ56_008978 [Daphnia magna]|uniref:Uncharacterized protein n=1 Tax=Daphnia magna TaxID=35525 RepID=A0ABR0AEM1_9CRUS|nr:hypothetical protein OUZ56_008978 [Daphnia magna]